VPLVTKLALPPDALFWKAVVPPEVVVTVALPAVDELRKVVVPPLVLMAALPPVELSLNTIEPSTLVIVALPAVLLPLKCVTDRAPLLVMVAPAAVALSLKWRSEVPLLLIVALLAVDVLSKCVVPLPELVIVIAPAAVPLRKWVVPPALAIEVTPDMSALTRLKLALLVTAPAIAPWVPIAPISSVPALMVVAPL
jgi:hypothetical protein